MRHRFEPFGGIIASEEPPFLAFVDRQMMLDLGLGSSPRWQGPEQVGLLSAPTEVHFAATGACSNRCRHCYMESAAEAVGDMDAAGFRRALELLARMGVFHVALGGGEALLRGELFEIAAYARELGLVPNLTISGAALTPELARRMTLFGQVNVSLDGIGEAARTFRSAGQVADAERSIAMLRASGVATGINCVVGRRNFAAIEPLFAYAAAMGCNEIELLRFKPVGRGRALAAEERTSYEQNVALVPMITKLADRHGVTAKVDCSFVPMICHHGPARELLETTATYGCEAGNVLLGVRSDGTVGGCSFLPRSALSVFELPERWESEPDFVALRSWPTRAPEPCRSCEYLDICKGGCHAVALAVTGSLDHPDPDCPRVVEYGRPRP